MLHVQGTHVQLLPATNGTRQHGSVSPSRLWTALAGEGLAPAGGCLHPFLFPLKKKRISDDGGRPDAWPQLCAGDARRMAENLVGDVENQCGELARILQLTSEKTRAREARANRIADRMGASICPQRGRTRTRSPRREGSSFSLDSASGQEAFGSSRPGSCSLPNNPAFRGLWRLEPSIFLFCWEVRRDTLTSKDVTTMRGAADCPDPVPGPAITPNQHHKIADNPAPSSLLLSSPCSPECGHGLQANTTDSFHCRKNLICVGHASFAAEFSVQCRGKGGDRVPDRFASRSGYIFGFSILTH